MLARVCVAVTEHRGEHIVVRYVVVSVPNLYGRRPLSYAPRAPLVTPAVWLVMPPRPCVMLHVIVVRTDVIVIVVVVPVVLLMLFTPEFYCTIYDSRVYRSTEC